MPTINCAFEKPAINLHPTVKIWYLFFLINPNPMKQNLLSSYTAAANPLKRVFQLRKSSQMTWLVTNLRSPWGTFLVGPKISSRPKLSWKKRRSGCGSSSSVEYFLNCSSLQVSGPFISFLASLDPTPLWSQSNPQQLKASYRWQKFN